MSKRVLHLLVGLLFLIGQSAALGHSLSHLLAGETPLQQQKKPLPHGKQCERCAPCAQLDHAAAPSLFRPQAVAGTEIWQGTRPIHCAGRVAPSARARDPQAIS